MNGRVIGSTICVDCFPEIQNGMYFLTQPVFNFSLPNFVDRIYTSTYNSRILQTKFQVHSDRVHSLSTNQKFLIQDQLKKLNFYVTLIDANQTPGAVMFLFEGEDIGNLLYAGKFCYSHNITSKIKTFLDKKKVDTVFTTDVFKNCKEHSKSKEQATEEVVDIIRRNSNQRVIIFEPYLREDIFTSLLDKLKNPISVSENVMKHLEELGRGSDFTLNTFSSKVHITDRLIDERSSKKRNNLYKIILIPCPLKVSEGIDQKIRKLAKKLYHVILYRNHCSEPQLKEFLNLLTPRRTVLLNPDIEAVKSSCKRNDIYYWSQIQYFPDIVSRFDYLHQVQETQTSKKANDDKLLNNVTSETYEVMDIEEKPQTFAETFPCSLVSLDSKSESDCSEKT